MLSSIPVNLSEPLEENVSWWLGHGRVSSVSICVFSDVVRNWLCSGKFSSEVSLSIWDTLWCTRHTEVKFSSICDRSAVSTRGNFVHPVCCNITGLTAHTNSAYKAVSDIYHCSSLGLLIYPSGASMWLLTSALKENRLVSLFNPLNINPESSRPMQMHHTAWYCANSSVLVFFPLHCCVPRDNLP